MTGQTQDEPPGGDSGTVMPAWTSAAARNNAGWCDALCRTHGASTTVDKLRGRAEHGRRRSTPTR